MTSRWFGAAPNTGGPPRLPSVGERSTFSNKIFFPKRTFTFCRCFLGVPLHSCRGSDLKMDLKLTFKKLRKAAENSSKNWGISRSIQGLLTHWVHHKVREAENSSCKFIKNWEIHVHSKVYSFIESIKSWENQLKIQKFMWKINRLKLNRYLPGLQGNFEHCALITTWPLTRLSCAIPRNAVSHRSRYLSQGQSFNYCRAPALKCYKLWRCDLSFYKNWVADSSSLVSNNHRVHWSTQGQNYDLLVWFWQLSSRVIGLVCEKVL